MPKPNLLQILTITDALAALDRSPNGHPVCGTCRRVIEKRVKNAEPFACIRVMKIFCSRECMYAFVEKP